MAASTYRATKSGINKEVEKKRKENYPHEEEAKAKTWIEAVLDIKMEKLFFEELHDGTILCSLLNKLQEGLIPIKHTKPTTMAFKQIENINMFLNGCKEYGMSEKDLFVTLDLHEQQNTTMVIATLFSLGRQAQKKNFQGPVIGPKEAEKNPREFSEQDLREGRNVIGLQMGTNQVAHQAGMTPYGLGRQIADTHTT